jgi:hypothetical protein
MEPSWHGFGAGTGPTQARNRAEYRQSLAYESALRCSSQITRFPAASFAEHPAESRPKFLLSSSAPASCGSVAEPVGTRQCSPLCFDERAEERAALTVPASPLPAAQDMKRGHSRKEIWLRAKGKSLECPAFFVPDGMRQTGLKRSGDGTREEAYT